MDKNNRSPADIAKFQKSIKCYEILRSRQKEEKKRKNKNEYLGGDREENNFISLHLAAIISGVVLQKSCKLTSHPKK